MGNLWDKLIVALDVKEKEPLVKLIDTLSPKVKCFKVGLIAYTKFGPDTIKWIQGKGAEIFLDFKLFDIPHTMVETARSFIDLGVWAFTVHVKAGREALVVLRESIDQEAETRGKRAPLIIGVTELTSKETALGDVLGLAEVAAECKLDGVVCSVWEAKEIKEKYGLRTITPGIRNTKCADDQKRVATVADVVANGVDYFVVGRPIVAAPDYLAAAQTLLDSKS